MVIPIFIIWTSLLMMRADMAGTFNQEPVQHTQQQEVTQHDSSKISN